MSTPQEPPSATSLVGLPHGRRLLILAILGTLARLVLGFTFIVLVLTLVPDNPDGRVAAPIIVALGGIAIYTLFFRRQLRGVYKAKYPNLRAAEALILVAAMFLALFSMVYVMLSMADPNSFTVALDQFTAYYFSLTVLATVGFGDITPVTTLARSVTMVQMALDLAFIAIIIRVMGSAAKKALEMRQAETAKAVAAAQGAAAQAEAAEDQAADDVAVIATADDTTAGDTTAKGAQETS